jgi:hypothetical protein
MAKTTTHQPPLPLHQLSQRQLPLKLLLLLPLPSLPLPPLSTEYDCSGLARTILRYQ